MLKCLCLTAMVLPSVSAAQVILDPEGVRQPPRTTFDTRDEAIRLLLPNDQVFTVVPGLDTLPNSENPLATNCAIGVRPSELTGLNGSTGSMNRGRIGEDLSRHCDGSGNAASGVALGGGLGSLQPFRTVAIPELDRAQEEGTAIELETARNFLEVGGDGDVALRLAAPGKQLLFGIERTDLTLSGTRYGARAEGDGFGVVLGGTSTSASGNRTFGALFTYSDHKGSLASDLDTVVDEELNGLVQQGGVTFADICGIPGGGTLDSRQLGLQLFGREMMRAETFIDYGIGVGRTRDSYAIKNCIVSRSISNPLSLFEVFAGTLSAKPVTHHANVFVRIGKRLPVGAATLIPSTGLGLTAARRSGYAESEQSADTLVNNPGGFGHNEATRPLGTALVFDESRTTRAELRLGLDYEVPFRVASSKGTLRLRGGVTHLFGDGQERVTARFLEDGRDNPLKFSFLDRPLDRTWGDISVSVTLPVGKRGGIDVGAETLVGNSFIKHTTIHAGFAMTF